MALPELDRRRFIGLGAGIALGSFVSREAWQGYQEYSRPTYEEYNNYIKGFEPIAPEQYNLDEYLGSPLINSIELEQSTKNPESYRFQLESRDFVCLRVTSDNDPNYSIGLFKASIDTGIEESDQLSYVVPVIQAPNYSDQTVYFGYLEPGSHTVEVQSVSNPLYEESSISNVEAFSIRGNSMLNQVLAGLKDVGLRKDLVKNGNIILNLPLSTALVLMENPNSEEVLAQKTMDLTGEFGGFEPKKRISEGDYRVFDSEWVIIQRFSGSRDLIERVYQTKGHGVGYVESEEFSLNIAEHNNMFRIPRDQNIVANLLPGNILGIDTDKEVELEKAKRVLSVLEEIKLGRLSAEDEVVRSHLEDVDIDAIFANFFARY